MTPEERERLTRQLTVITASLPSQKRKDKPTKVETTTTTQAAVQVAQPMASSEPSAAPVGTSARLPAVVAERATDVAEDVDEVGLDTDWSRLRFPLPRLSLRRWRGWRMGLFVAIVIVALLGTGLAEGLTPQFFGFGGQLFGLVPAPPTVTPVPTEAPFDDIARPPSITVAEIDRVLGSVNSPIWPYSGDVYAYGIQYGIDPVFALAFWMKESREASDGSVAAPDHNPGYTEGLTNDPKCGRWACWPTWPEGIAGWFRYMRVFFVDRGISTVESILPIYAPSSENNTSGYIVFVLQHVATWRAESAAKG